jgi:hypothetical protein
VRVGSPKTKDIQARTNQLDRRLAKGKLHKREHKKKPSLGTQARINSRKDIQNGRTRMPIKPARRQEVRAEDQRYTGKQVQKVQRKSSSQPMRRQEVQAENQRQAGREKQRKRGESRIKSRNKSSLQAQGSNSGRAPREETRQDLEPQQSQPRWQKNRRNAEKQRNITARTLGSDVSSVKRHAVSPVKRPASCGAANPRSRFRFGKD